MKKIILLFVMLFSFELLSAKSDIQVTSKIVRILENYEIDACGLASKLNKSFAYPVADLIALKNYNFIKESPFGFYESVMLTTEYEPVYYSCQGVLLGERDFYSNYIGIQLSAGPAFMILNKEYFAINCSVGPHLKIFEKGIVFGLETDVQVKITPKRRCSPVIGATINYDFYSNLKASENILITEVSPYYVTKYSMWVERDISRFSHFYISPYISFCVNF